MDNKTKLEGLKKAVEDLHSYINVVKSGTFPGKSIQDASKLLNFLQNNFNNLLKQFEDLNAKVAEEQKPVEKEEEDVKA